MFGNRKAKEEAAAFYGELNAQLKRRERNANANLRDAEAREKKWAGVIRNMTGRGEDHEGRDMAIRNRDKARRDQDAAKVELMAVRSNYR
ncbi:hypothetical protein [Streptomyces lydicus]|uniref:hypothetical protein n=1 Tax=Streptomyces lydicus TaxID=47763 RepID=UPI0036E1160C